MWPINNDKGVHYDELKYLSVNCDLMKPKNVLNSDVIAKQSCCLVDTLLEKPIKCNYKKIDDAEMTYLSIKSNVEKQQNISEICLKVCQLRCRAGASPKRSRNFNPYQQEKKSGMNYSVGHNLSQQLISNELPAVSNRNKTIRPNLNITCDDSRSDKYRTSKMSSQSLDKNKSRPKRPRIDQLERTCEDIRRCRRPHWSETNICDQQRPNRKNLKRSNPKLVAPSRYESDYYDDEADMLNGKHHRETLNKQKEIYNRNMGMDTWQQSCLDFMPYMDDTQLSDGELACNDQRNELIASSEEWSRQRVERPQRQEEERPRYEKRPSRRNEWPQRQEDRQSRHEEWPLRYNEYPQRQKERKPQNRQWPPRQKERQQFQDEQRLSNVQQTDDELAKVETQRFNLLKCIERHQRTLAVETQQLLKYQHSHRRLKTNNENEELRLMIDSKCSIGKEQEQNKKQQCQVREQYESTSMEHNQSRSAEEESLISPRKPQRDRRMLHITTPSAYCNISVDEPQREPSSNALCTTSAWQTQVRPKRSTPNLSPQRLNINNIDEFNDSQSLTTLHNAWLRRATVDVTTLQPQQFNCDCEIEQLDEKEQRNAGSRPAANIKNDDQFRQSRSRSNKSRTMETNSVTGCASKPLVSLSSSQLQRSQLECETCGARPTKSKSSVIKYD